MLPASQKDRIDFGLSTTDSTNCASLHETMSVINTMNLMDYNRHTCMDDLPTNWIFTILNDTDNLILTLRGEHLYCQSFITVFVPVRCPPDESSSTSCLDYHACIMTSYSDIKCVSQCQCDGLCQVLYVQFQHPPWLEKANVRLCDVNIQSLNNRVEL